MINFKNQITFKTILFINIVASTCCIIYELNLAQLLSATLGNTVLRYSLTVGIYLAAMGFGSIFLSKEEDIGDNEKIEISLLERLFKIELILSLLGLLSPLVLLSSDALLRHHKWEILNLNQAIGYSLVMVIGLFTGAELPTLLQIGKKIKPNESYWILIVDYVGTVIGSIVFPFYLLSNLGVIMTSIATSFINFCLSVFILIQINKSHWKTKMVIILILLFYMLIAVNYNQFSDWITKEVYLS